MRFICKSEPVDKRRISFLSEKYDLHPVVAEILISRGFGDDLDSFLFGGELYNPVLLSDMQKAVDCIKKHIEESDAITVYGDYDADGACSSAIVYLYLKSIGANVDVFLPDREKDGYGLNENSIEAIAKSGTKLLITVDCGISNVKEVAFAKELGLDVIVTDHHQCPSNLPVCEAVVNPLLGDYPCSYICGSGVALKLVMALGAKAEDYIDLAAIATITDVVPLTDENRAIVIKGLKKINSEDIRTGISALCAAAGISGEVSSGHIGFALGPRINAAGRMASAKKAFDLLVCTDYKEAVKIADDLNGYNNNRRDVEEDILKQAIDIIETSGSLKKEHVIIVSGDNWNKGVIGIVAGKLVERYSRPVIVFSNENGVLTGSGRSIAGIHLFNLLSRFGGDFIKFGGHEMAAGMSLEESRLKTVSNKINDYVNKNYDESLFIPSMQYDAEVELEAIDNKLVEGVKRLAPTGIGNKTPLFLVPDVEIKEARHIGNGKNHVKMSVCKDGISCDGVAFSMGDRFNEIKHGIKYDLLVNVDFNNWNGRDYIQLQIREFKPAKNSLAESFAVKNGDKFFDSLLSAADLPIVSIDQKRIRRMWNWEIYLERRLNKDVLNTVVLSSIPLCAKGLINYIVKRGLFENVDFSMGKAIGNSCVVVAPDWNEDEFNCERLVIFDYAPTDFIARVLKNNPNLQIVICSNDYTQNTISEFCLGLGFGREKAARFYNIFNNVCNNKVSKDSLIEQFCAFGNDTAFNAEYALNVFYELGFIKLEDGVVEFIKDAQKKELSLSGVIHKMSSMSDRIGGEIEMIKPERKSGARAK